VRPLNIVVCIKQVPDSRYWDRLALDPKTKLLTRAGIPITIGPMDKNALEEALRIREARGGKITVVSMGPPNTKEILMTAFALGADDAVLLSDRAFGGADTLATAYVLANGIKKLGGADLVLLGSESLDGSTGQVGPQVAEFLGLPSVTRVSQIEFKDDDTLHVRSNIEMGYMNLEVPLPAVLAVSGDINVVRLPTMFGALWATEKTAKVWSCEDLSTDSNACGLAGSPTWVPSVTTIEMKRRGEVLKGDPSEIARQLIEKLRTDGVLPKIQ
jgi:electron transfer flavoprotein beta subunit